MILPIYAYGQAVLKKKAEEISPDYPELNKLLEDMWETMYQADGVGLAAPQIGKSIRLFLVDTMQIMEEGKEAEGIKQVFINAQKVEESGEPWNYEEGCLSIPHIRGEVERPKNLSIRFLDENFQEQIKTFEGINARVIQHEYDHIEGVLFVEHLKPIKKRMIQRKLDDIKKGKVSVDYKIKFPLDR
ncbi:MAG TPA: peptide deformylase [Saprospiraceae bacterium]|nr:peptide deformylase [Saprospiraceae bacterium]HMQ85037.1 peptide deformylase [Saprospiraceae bacterium]